MSKLAFYMLLLSLSLQTVPWFFTFNDGTDLAIPGKMGRFSCTYGGLWCECYTNNRGGCSVGCSPGIYQTWENQTGCPQRENFFLVGMELM